MGIFIQGIRSCLSGHSASHFQVFAFGAWHIKHDEAKTEILVCTAKSCIHYYIQGLFLFTLVYLIDTGMYLIAQVWQQGNVCIRWATTAFVKPKIESAWKIDFFFLIKIKHKIAGKIPEPAPLYVFIQNGVGK